MIDDYANCLHDEFSAECWAKIRKGWGLGVELVDVVEDFGCFLVH